MMAIKVALAVTGLISGLVGIVVEAAKINGGIFVNRLKEVARVHAEPRPMGHLELIQVGNATDEPEMLNVWLSSTLPRIDGRANRFLMGLARKENISHWSGSSHFLALGNSSGGESLRQIAGASSAAIEEFTIGFEPAAWDYFQRWAMSKVLNTVVRFDLQPRRDLQNINRNWPVQSNPSTFCIYPGLPLYSGLRSHFLPHALSEEGIPNDRADSNHFSERLPPCRFWITAIVGFVFGWWGWHNLSNHRTLFWRTVAFLSGGTLWLCSANLIFSA